MSDEASLSIDGSALRDNAGGSTDSDLVAEADTADPAESAFAQASTVTNAEPIESLNRFGLRRRPRERLALQPDEVQLATATVKLRSRQQDVRLKRLLARFAVFAVGAQLLVADLILMRWIVLGDEAPSDTVLIAWMSSTVVEVIGIVAIVARNLFPSRQKKQKKQR